MPGIDWGGDVQILAYSGRDAAEIEAALPRWTDDVPWPTVRQEAARSRERFPRDHPLPSRPGRRAREDRAGG